MPFNFMAAVSVCSDFGAQKNYGYYGMSIVSFWEKECDF